MDEAYTVETLRVDDWPSVAAIYEEGIRTRNATFQEIVPSWTEWDESHLQVCRLVAKKKEEVLGWAALSPTSSRQVYRGVAEVSVYIGESHRGQRIGTKLLTKLIHESEVAGIWMLSAGIFPENLPSVKLHLACGFREVGRRERIGQMDGIWRDVLLLERRSHVVGYVVSHRDSGEL